MKPYKKLSERRFNPCHRCAVPPIPDVDVIIEIKEQVKGTDNLIATQLCTKVVKASSVVGSLKKSDLELDNLVALGALDRLTFAQCAGNTFDNITNLEAGLAGLPQDSSADSASQNLTE